MLYTLCWNDNEGYYCELDYGTLAEAQLHMDYLVYQCQIVAYIRCEELN